MNEASGFPLNVSLVSMHPMPEEPIWTRLGYRQKTSDQTLILSKYQSLIKRFLRETQIRLFYREAGFQAEGDLVAVDRHRFSSRLVAERCAGAQRVYLLGASVRQEDFRQLQSLQEQNRLEEAVVLDAVLSEKVDYALDFIEKGVNLELRRKGQVMGARLSCGYGDFSLENQRFFYNVLEFSRYGIILTPQYLLIPEKTVTGLAPVRPLEVRI